MTSPTPPTLTPALLAEGWFRRFVNRPAPHALQQADGSYRWIATPCTPDVLTAHLRGELTLALASADAASQTRWVCLDVDVPGTLPQLAVLGAALEELGVPNLVEESRRGGHLWVFYTDLVPVHMARFLLRDVLIMASREGLEVPAHELYPLGAAPTAMAQAVRLPLGIHRKSDTRYPLWDYPSQGDKPLTWSVEVAAGLVLATAAIPAATAHARWAARVPFAASHSLLPSMPHEPVALPPSQGIGTRSGVIRWVDAHVDPRELLADLAPRTELRRQGHGYLGWCPFHDDRAADVLGRPGSPSFYVVHDRRYGWSWKCFSTNCRYASGHLKHPFRLLQELLGVSVAQAVVVALDRWPEADDSVTPSGSVGRS